MLLLTTVLLFHPCALPFPLPYPQLLCNLKVVWSEEGAGVVRNRREDQSLFAKDLGKLTEGLEQVGLGGGVWLRLWWWHQTCGVGGLLQCTAAPSCWQDATSVACAAPQHPPCPRLPAWMAPGGGGPGRLAAAAVAGARQR